MKVRKLKVSSLIIIISGLVVWAVFLASHMNFTLLPEVSDPYFILKFDIKTGEDELIKEHRHSFISLLGALEGVENVEIALSESVCEIEIKVSRQADHYSLQYLLQEQINELMVMSGLAHHTPIVRQRDKHKLPAIELYIVSRDQAKESMLDGWVVNTVQPQIALCSAAGKIDILGLGHDYYAISQSKGSDLFRELEKYSAWESKKSHGGHSYIFRHPSVPVNKMADLVRQDSIMQGMSLVWRRRTEYPTGQYYFNGERAVFVRIYLRPGHSQFELKRQVDTLIHQLEKGNSYSIVKYRDQVEDLTGKIRSILISLGITLFAIFSTILLFTRSVKLGLFMATVLVIALAMTIILMGMLKLQLDIIVLAGILIGIGLLVDNPIIISAEFAGSSRTRNVIPPLVIANCTTVLVFIPILVINRLSFEIFSGFLLALIILLTTSFGLGLALTHYFIRRRIRIDHGYGRDLTSRPRTVIAISVLVIGISLIFIQGMKQTWLPSYGSQYWTIGANRPVTLKNVSAVIDHRMGDLTMREVKLSEKVLAMDDLKNAKKVGDPYNALFGNMSYSWYRPYDSTSRQLWKRSGLRMVKSYSTPSYTDIEMPRRNQINLGAETVILEKNISLDMISRRHAIKLNVRPRQAEFRQDNFGELIRLDGSSADTLGRDKFKIENSDADGVAQNNEAAWTSVVIIGLGIMIGLFFYFKSLWLSIWVMLAIPVSMLGSVTTLHLAGLSVNIISITAIVFSSGVGINDAVIKAHTLVGLLKEGMDFSHALRVASQKRFIPILLTSVTTLISCIVQVALTPAWDQIQLSICIAMIGGIMYSTLWAVFSMPALLKTVGRNYRIVQPMG